MLEPGQPRSFLFLQGPHGPFFFMLARALERLGHKVRRINLNGGDKLDWPGCATDYRGTRREWPLFLDDYLIENVISDLVLFGDCRDWHKAAHGIAQLRRVQVHVLEEGYIRPDFVTFEKNGVNGNSGLPRDPNWYLEHAIRLPSAGAHAPVPSDWRRRLRLTSRYALASFFYKWRFPHYQSHRPQPFWLEAIGWAIQLTFRKLQEVCSEKIWVDVRFDKYFVLPLQLNSDYQLRVHSPFGDMRGGLRFVIKSFARFAPSDAKLLIKRHPLDPGLVGWGRLIRGLADVYGVNDRVRYVRQGDISNMVQAAMGVVTVNSTVGTLALNYGVPVSVLGHAVYGLPGIIDERPLDEFWQTPQRPDAELYDSFCRVLQDRCLIHGGLLSDEGLNLLVRNAVERLVPGRTCSNTQAERISACV